MVKPHFFTVKSQVFEMIKSVMWLKQCHKPPMTGNGIVYTTYKNGTGGCFNHCLPTYFLLGPGSSTWWPSMLQSVLARNVASGHRPWPCYEAWRLGRFPQIFVDFQGEILGHCCFLELKRRFSQVAKS